MACEPQIIINGVQLTEAQAMTVRVAVVSFQSNQLSNPNGLGGDEHGRAMARLYGNHANDILDLMGLYQQSAMTP
ncbi:MAG: hypothetical protein FD131_3318 [Rhodocyclaceae bacterium]|nr:MAG: hypothetical protein FD131_3318 [Rhodocyclaceae bacterium]